MNILANLNLNQNQIQNAVIQPLATAPSNPKVGQIYFNSTDMLIYIYFGQPMGWFPAGAVYNQGSTTGAVITGITRAGTITTTNVTGLTLTGYTPVDDGTVKANMTLEEAFKALDTALANIGGELGQGYVKKAGDTMTGDLTIQKNSPQIKMSDSTTGNIGTATISVNGNHFIVSNVGGYGYYSGLDMYATDHGPVVNFETRTGMTTLKGIQDGTSDTDAVSVHQLNSITIQKLEAATEGYLASYQLYRGETAVGEVINIPKDYLVKSASVKTAGADDPSGFAEGTKYIDFIVNTYDTASGTGAESHIYLNVEDLVDVYTGGNGIDISDTNVISVKVVASNGLSVDSEGIKMGVASTTANGAMTSAMVTKLDGIDEQATKNTITLNGTATKTPSFYAPTTAGTKGQVLLSNGEGAPTWSAMPESFHKYTATNGALTASGGTYAWSIPAATHGISDSAIIVQLYEVATGAQVMADVTVNQTNYNVTVSIVGTGTLAAGTYRAVLFG